MSNRDLEEFATQQIQRLLALHEETVKPLKPQLSLRARLLLLVSMAVAPAFGLVVFSTWEDRVAADTEAQRQTRQLALIVAAEHARLIEQGRQLLITLSSLPAT